MSVTNIRVRTTSSRPNPASAERRLDDLEGGPRLGRDVTGMARPAVRARRRSSRRPSTNRRRRRPAVAADRPPTDRPRRSAGARSSLDGGAVRRRGRPARRAPRGSRGDGEQQPGQQRRPRHDRIDLEVLGREHGRCRRSGRARRGSGCPSRRSCWHRTRRRSRRRRRRSRAPRATPWAWSTSRPLRSSFSIGHQRAIGSTVDGRVGDLGRLGDPADLGLGRLERVARRPPARRLRASSARRRRWAASRRRRRPTLTVTSGQRPLSACRSRDDPGGLEDGAAPLLGLDAGMGGTAVDDDAQVEDALARRRRCRRWRGRTRGPGATSLSAAISRMCGVERRRADLLVRVGDEHEPLEGQPAALGPMIALSAYSPASRPGLHVGDARPVGDAVVDPERPFGDGARVEDRVHVADEQDARPAGAAVERGHDAWRPSRPAGSGRVSTSRRRARSRKAATQRPTASTPGGRVAPAVDVDEALEVGEVGRQVGVDGGAQRVELDRRRGRAGSRSRRSSAQSSRWHLAILPGPCDWSRPACSKVPTSTGSSRWSSSRSPSAGDGRGTASAIPARHALVHLGAAVPTRDWPDARRRDRGLDPPAARRPRRGPRRAGGPSLVGSGALDRHVPVGRRRAGADPDRGRPGPRRARRLAVARRARLTGAQERLLGALDGADRGRARDAARVDPRRRPPGPDRVDLGDQRQEHGHPADHPHPAARRPACRDDHLGRGPRRRADGRAGDWTGPGGAHQILARRDIDVAVLETARGGIVLRGVGYESNEASVLTNVSSDHLDLQGIHTLPELAEVKSTICRITRPDGWVVLNADDPLVAAVARRVRGAGRAVHAPGGDASGSCARHRDARRARVSRARRDASSRRTATARPRSSRSSASRSRSAGWRATTSPTRSPRPAGRAGWARRSSRSATGLTDFAADRRAIAGPAEPVPARGARRHRRLRPQRGRGRGGARRRRGDRRRGRRPCGADHGDHRHRGRPAGRHAARDRPDRRRAGPAGRHQADPASTCAGGPPNRSSASCWPASWPAAGRPPTCRSTSRRPRRSGPS